jgi:antitoxin MazE
MVTKVQKWGNSLGIRIPKFYAQKVKIESGSTIDIEIEDEKLIIKPGRHSYKLKDLVSKINNKNIHSEVDTGNQVGKEIW